MRYRPRTGDPLGNAVDEHLWREEDLTAELSLGGIDLLEGEYGLFRGCQGCFEDRRLSAAVLAWTSRDDDGGMGREVDLRSALLQPESCGELPECRGGGDDLATRVFVPGALVDEDELACIYVFGCLVAGNDDIGDSDLCPPDDTSDLDQPGPRWGDDLGTGAALGRNELLEADRRGHEVGRDLVKSGLAAGVLPLAPDDPQQCRFLGVEAINLHARGERREGVFERVGLAYDKNSCVQAGRGAFVDQLRLGNLEGVSGENGRCCEQCHEEEERTGDRKCGHGEPPGNSILPCSVPPSLAFVLEALLGVSLGSFRRLWHNPLAIMRRFLEQTLDLLLALGARLGLLEGNPQWYKARLLRRLEHKRRDVENLRRGIAATHRMCRECGALVARQEDLCPSCGAMMAGIPRGGAGRVLQTLVPSLGSVPTIFVGIMVAVYLVGAVILPDPKAFLLAPSGEILWKLGAMVPERLLLGGEWWRLVNPIFLHGSELHMAFNGYVLTAIGPLIEGEIGARKFTVLFLVTGIASFVFSALGALFLTPHWSVGASGSIFGILGFGIVAGFRRGSGVLRAAAPNFLFWALINFVIGMGVSVVDNGAHLGGFAAGGLFGLFFQDARVRSALKERIWTLTTVLLSLLPLAGFLMALLRY